MPRHRRQLAEQVAASLHEAEQAIDAALIKTARFTGLMPSVREEARLSALVGQDALERAGEVVAALLVARRGIVETHKELTRVQGDIGLGAVAFGDGIAKPNLAAEPRRLRAVASRDEIG